MEIAKTISESYNELLNDIKTINKCKSYLSPPKKFLFFSIITRVAGVWTGFVSSLYIAGAIILAVKKSPFLSALAAAGAVAHGVAAHEVIVVGNNLRKGTPWRKLISIFFGFTNPYDFYLKDTLLAKKIAHYCEQLPPPKK